MNHEQGDDEEGKTKSKLLSLKTMWNNVKYGMKLRTNFSRESPVWLLGRCYHRKEDQALSNDPTRPLHLSNTEDVEDEQQTGFEGFKHDFISRIWLTYRREFPVLTGSTFSSDCGWGCMLRSGQMLIAQALLVHILGRDWRWQEDVSVESHRNIIQWFGDKDSRKSPLSIHRLVELGEGSKGRKAGDWYGPSTVAYILRDAVRLSEESIGVRVYVAQDCCIYKGDILQNTHWTPLVLLIPVRLGATDKLNPAYIPCLQSILSLEQSLGIMGGRPKHALYIIGYQDDKLIHLDPHYCQEMVDVWCDDFPLETFHCKSPRKLLFSRMDPSCCLGFYVERIEDFTNLVCLLEEVAKPNNCYPMFSFSDGFSCDVRQPLHPQLQHQHLEHQHPILQSNTVQTHYETEPFEFI